MSKAKAKDTVSSSAIQWLYYRISVSSFMSLFYMQVVHRSHVVLEDKVLISRRLEEDKNQSLGLETKSFGTLKTFASMINLFRISITVNLRIACTEYDCMSLTSIGKHILQQVSCFTYFFCIFLKIDFIDNIQ